MSTVIHIAAQQVTIGPYLRQLCAWCGYQLIREKAL